MTAFATPAQAPRWKRWLVYSPLARIVIFALVMAACAFLCTRGLKLAGVSATQMAQRERALVGSAIQLVCSVVAYLFLVRAVEHRWPAELGLRGLARGIAAGTLAGIALISTVVLLLWACGSYRITAVDLSIDWWTPLLTAGFAVAVSEEIITRGVLFRIAEEGLGTTWALAISALFFGGAHIFNPGATVWSSVAIAIEAGLLLGLLYHVTRSLWPCIGLHMGWNYAQGTLWGIPISGTRVPTFVTSERSGPNWLSGGIWGAEASVIAVLVCFAATMLLFLRAYRRGTFVKRGRAQRPIIAAAPAAPVASA
jgi:membrane protease YdiL (CAAX protease family)